LNVKDAPVSTVELVESALKIKVLEPIEIIFVPVAKNPLTILFPTVRDEVLIPVTKFVVIPRLPVLVPIFVVTVVVSDVVPIPEMI